MTDMRVLLKIREAAGHWGSTPRIRPTSQTLRSYPHPPKRRTSRLRLLPPGPSQVRLANAMADFPTETAWRPPALRDE